MAQITSTPGSRIINLSDEDKARGVGDSLWTIAMRRIRRDRLTMIAIIILAFMTVMAVSAPLWARALNIDPDKVSGDHFLRPGEKGHILGTDDLGRDYFVRVLYAGQISLGIAFAASALSVVFGISLGVWAGYKGGRIDDFLSWFIATLDSIPSLYLLLLISSFFRPSATTLIIVLGLLGWTGTMRLVRGETFSLREREFVMAAQSIGVSPLRIMFVHIMPNILSVIIVTMALNVGGLILTESALSFLGFGVKPPTASWGYMLTDVRNFYTLGPHMVFPPGILITLTVLCTFIIGDGLRDAFDPKLKER